MHVPGHGVTVRDLFTAATRSVRRAARQQPNLSPTSADRPADGSPDWKCRSRIERRTGRGRPVRIPRMRPPRFRGGPRAGRRGRARRLGEVHTPIYPRSSNKPMQAVALLRNGFEPSDDPQSSRSRPRPMRASRDHVELVERLLDRYGLDEDQLRCPADLPSNELARAEVLAAGAPPAPVYMNCSGKHAAMLATCRHNDWPLRQLPRPRASAATRGHRDVRVDQPANPRPNWASTAAGCRSCRCRWRNLGARVRRGSSPPNPARPSVASPTPSASTRTSCRAPARTTRG